MARWTNDHWVSTIHRVVNHGNENKRRQSIAFFHNVNADQMIEAIPTCVGPNNPPKYPPIKAWDLLIEKHNASVRNGGKY
jgi:isopenicillin N synthase-like dioxygenase